MRIVAIAHALFSVGCASSHVVECAQPILIDTSTAADMNDLRNALADLGPVERDDVASAFGFAK